MRKIVFVTVLLTGLALSILPREYYTEDLAIHSPFILKRLYPHLYPGDYLFTYTNPQTATVYYPLVTKVLLFLNLSLPATLRLLYGISLLLIFLGFLIVSIRLWGSIFIGSIWLLFLLLRIPIGGAAIQTLELEFLPRTLAVVPSIWSVVFLLNQSNWEAFLLLLFTAIIHPLSAVFLASIMGIGFLTKQKLDSKKYLFLGGSSIIILLVIIRLIPPISSQWLDILRLRNSYAFLDLWKVQSWLILLISLLPGIWYSFLQKNSKKRVVFIFKLTLVTALGATVIHFILAIFYPLSFIINLQLGRIWWYPVAISLGCMAVLITQITGYKQIMALVFILGLVIARNILVPNEVNAKWLLVQQWVSDQTKTNCGFLVPFRSRGFRVESQRTSMGEHKDGALSLYSADFAREWSRRLTELGSWQTLTDAEIASLRQRYRFEYIVDETRYPRRVFPIMYENEDFRVYQLATCV